jgi:hypothetical protein
MKHAGKEALDGLEDVLAAVRRHARLKERTRGVFYLGGSAFLHFHEDPAGPFADLKVEGRWKRLRVATKSERAAFVRETARAVAG